MRYKGHGTGNIGGVGFARNVQEVSTHVDARREEVESIGKHGHLGGVTVAVNCCLENGDVVHPNHVAAPQNMGEGEDGGHKSKELALVDKLPWEG